MLKQTAIAAVAALVVVGAALYWLSFNPQYVAAYTLSPAPTADELGLTVDPGGTSDLSVTGSNWLYKPHNRLLLAIYEPPCAVVALRSALHWSPRTRNQSTQQRSSVSGLSRASLLPVRRPVVSGFVHPHNGQPIGHRWADPHCSPPTVVRRQAAH